jgi:hypothetical protein
MVIATGTRSPDARPDGIRMRDMGAKMIRVQPASLCFADMGHRKGDDRAIVRVPGSATVAARADRC